MQLFDYARATALMEEAGIDLILANSMTNVSYLLDYYASQTLFTPSMVLDDGSMYYQSFAGLPADEQLEAFFTPWVGEAGYLCDGATWVQDLRYYGQPIVTPGLETTSHPQAADPISCAVMAIKDRKLESPL